MISELETSTTLFIIDGVVGMLIFIPLQAQDAPVVLSPGEIQQRVR